MSVVAPAAPLAPSYPRHRTGFVVALAGLTAMMVGASAPSPFYPVLQEQLHFSAVALTGIFAVYTVALLATLLLVGSLSDHVGRRPVVSAGFVVLAASMALFWQADTVPLLVVARVVQGVATGMLLSALSAAVVDLEPPNRPGLAATLNSVMPLAGLAVGAMGAGLLLEYGAAPMAMVFGALTTLFAATALAVWTLPETSPLQTGLLASLRPRVGIPAPARRVFLSSVPALVAGWSTGGLYLSLGPAIVGSELGGGAVDQGLVVAILMAVGAASCFVAREASPRSIMLFGTTALAGGTALTLVGLAAGSLLGFKLSVVVAGAGFGTSFLGVMRSITPTVGVHQRGELFAAVFVVSYLAFGIPTVLAGLAAEAAGLAATTYVYGGLVVALAALAAVLRGLGSTD